MDNTFLYGLLYLLQGRYGKARVLLVKFQNKPTRKKYNDRFKRVSEQLISYIDAIKAQDRNKQFDVLREMIKNLGNILSPEKGPKLALECLRNQKLGKANDGSNNGYSRDPFKKINDNEKPQVLLAAIIYLLK